VELQILDGLGFIGLALTDGVFFFELALTKLVSGSQCMVTTHVGVERQVPMEYGVGMTGNTVTQHIEWGTIALKLKPSYAKQFLSCNYIPSQFVYFQKQYSRLHASPPRRQINQYSSPSCHRKSNLHYIQSTPMKNPPPSGFNNPVSHPSTNNHNCPSKSLLPNKIHSVSQPTSRSTSTLSLSSHKNPYTASASNTKISAHTRQSPSLKTYSSPTLDLQLSPQCPMTNYFPTLATHTNVTTVFTSPFLPQTHRLLQKIYPISLSSSNPSILPWPIQAPNSSESYSHQPIATFLAFVQPFQALLSNLCSQLPTISDITAVPPIISRNLLLSQLNLFDSFPDHPG
jgi:hypothetical protein